MQNMNVDLQKAKAISIRSFYSINQNLLTFCENSSILLLEEQITESYCHLMSGLLNDHIPAKKTKDFIDLAEKEIYRSAAQGYTLGVLLEKLQVRHNIRKKILDEIRLHYAGSETDTLLSEYIIMTYWNTLETIQNFIVHTFGKEGNGKANRLQSDSLSAFLNQQLPVSLMEATQKARLSKDDFLTIYPKELVNWLGWLTGFYAKINQHSWETSAEEKINFLKSTAEHYTAPFPFQILDCINQQDLQYSFM